jgi:NADPH:quinone reductase-like Zn-dependent oxidoreductase
MFGKPTPEAVMKAAVVHHPGQPPTYRDFSDPVPVEGEELVEVVAAGLHQITRAQAAGEHYAGHSELPMIPGVDGVARRSDGSLIYIGGLKPPYGTFAERATVSGMALRLPDDCDPVVMAASLNPGSSGWMALRLRADLQPGQTVAVLGATGAAGRTAVQAAKLLKAAQVIAIGRSESGLAEVAEDADATVRIDGTDWTRQLAGPVDVVLDYLWGRPAEHLLPVLAGSTEGRRLTWVQIGTMAAPSMQLPAEVLRSSDVHLVGSGIGSTAMRDIAAEIPAVIEHIAAGRILVEPVVRRLSDVERAWNEPVEPGRRLVLVP